MALADCTVCAKPGAWTCAGCGAKCAEHVRRKRGAGVRFVCVSCLQPAELQRVRRADVMSFQDRAINALTSGMVGYPFVAAIVCGLLFSLASVVDLIGGTLGLVATLILGLAIMRAAADDEPFEPSRLSDPVENIGVPLARGLLTCAPAIIAVHVYVNLFVVFPYHRVFEHEHGLIVTLLMSPWFWLASIFCIGYLPLALLHATVAPSWGVLCNPIALFKPARKWRKEYLWFVAIAAIGFVVTILAALVTPVGWLGGLVTGIAAGWTGIVLMRVIGELIYLHPEELDWGAADEGWVDLGDPRAPALEESASIPPPQPRTVTVASLEDRIRAALDAKDAKLAVSAYRDVPHAEKELSQQTLLRLGQAAASIEEFKLALIVFLAASHENTPDGAKALIFAAMIFDERLRDTLGAKRLYQQVVERFPGSPAATRAQKELSDPRFRTQRTA